MIVGIFGNLSSGKTLFAIKLLYDNYLKNKISIYSNIYLKFPYKRHSLPDMINISRTHPDRFKNSTLFIDEIHTIVDARRSSSDLNQKFTQFSTQIGKLDCDLLFTSQIFSSQIDLRIRELCDILVFCQRKTLKNKPLFGKRKVSVPIKISGLIIVKQFGGAKLQQKKFSFLPEPYFNLYNTEELVLFNRDQFLK